MYTLPLSPIDLTTIYKQKLSEEGYMLEVDYTESKKVLSVKQMLIYLSNTGFTCKFSKVDNDLITEYIKLNFLVDSPMLSRVVGNLIKVSLNENVIDISDNFGVEDLVKFLKEDSDIINDLIDDIAGLPAFIIDTINEDKHIIDIDTSPDGDNDSLVGLNIFNILVHSTDAALVVFKNLGFRSQFNSRVFNNDPTCYGKDIYAALHENNIPAFVLGMLPPEITRESLT
ncbi:MAG: hypothetical protein NZ811_02740 [Gammaproteobacteria bacterium]|nr:hypothetical protein [Gammaproteobacteria bacterium]